MVKLSASKAWDETSGFLRAHGRLVFAVALAFMALPSILAAPWLSELQGRMMTGSSLAPEDALAAAPVFLLIVLVSLVGTLAIYTLALRPGVSVGEALLHGLKRLLPALGVTLLIGLVFAVLGVLYASIAVAGGQVAGAFLILLLIPVVVYLFTRLYLAQVAVVDGNGPISALRASWTLTAGNVGRLLVLLLVVFLVALIVYLAGTFVFAGLLGALGRAVGGESVGVLLGAVVTSILSAVLTTVIVVLVAQVYRQLRGDTGPLGEVFR